jgi:hypothetical protein
MHGLFVVLAVACAIAVVPGAASAASTELVAACPERGRWDQDFRDSLRRLSKPIEATPPDEVQPLDEYLPYLRTQVLFGGLAGNFSSEEIALIKSECALQTELMACPDCSISPFSRILHAGTIEFILMHLLDG